ncbi:GAF and ANTAR domain-containing protein [Streptomyces sp. JJ36]|uniref:GAF and ANTAR domain-containing protein n=1 Tax=Streptomyces sp. JJ36 TaxID=2736645 RepID=UPI001F3E1F65|nr:GAF and ANTAR domain-containing protein [Streptomyces sp. JJ36]MCF6522849.1 ANTAR domain-containing protein [Streptomyces sp. JJ36]
MSSRTPPPAPDPSPESPEGPVGASAGRSLARLAEQAVCCTPVCGAAAATASDPTEPVAGLAGPDAAMAVTHPDLAALLTVQRDEGEGPVLDALATDRPAGSADLLHDERWPGYRAAALDAGVRATATVPHHYGSLAVTVTVCFFRPYRLPDVVHGSTAVLADLAVAVLVRDRRYRDALAEAEQLDTALQSRPVIDQACGIVMHVLGCDAAEAFALLRRMSQRSNRKLHTLAEGLVRSRGRGLEEQIRTLGRSS